MKLVQMITLPLHHGLQGFMQLSQCPRGRRQQPAPDRRFGAGERYLDLKDLPHLRSVVRYHSSHSLQILADIFDDRMPWSVSANRRIRIGLERYRNIDHVPRFQTGSAFDEIPGHCSKVAACLAEAEDDVLFAFDFGISTEFRSFDRKDRRGVSETEGREVQD